MTQQFVLTEKEVVVILQQYLKLKFALPFVPSITSTTFDGRLESVTARINFGEETNDQAKTVVAAMSRKIETGEL